MLKHACLATAIALIAPTLFALAAQANDTVPVNADNFARAESDRYFSAAVAQGGFGQFHHHRTTMAIDKQTVIRPNRDTLYSAAVFDLDAGPVTITLPDAGQRYMSLQVINEDHYVTSVVYGQGSYTLSREQAGTRYAIVGVRTLFNPEQEKDLDQAHALQDAIKVSQAKPGSFEVPKWDPISQKNVRDALVQLGSTLPDTQRMFGNREQVDPVRHLIGAATAWGGNPEKDALYLTVTPTQNNGQTPYTLKVKDVPVNAFWSVSVYNAKAYFEPNALNAYSLNSLTAKRNKDGEAAIQFGGCDGKVANCLPITEGWNYTVRLYQPRAEILSGNWTFPVAQPLN
ncbi:DUF1254 domain-containing protein [Pseudomonas putida]|uniref:DUF1254 domain-containing protein n=1 Tax=Pseudomonas putida TaxID=303 RepID=A0A2Z4RDL0_PSEPU|nr:DUF1254 domain-containing protein [Pseudomonas putida]AWY39201.1 DUF1254 domain-containing protein [Pseudomonas putida]